MNIELNTGAGELAMPLTGNLGIACPADSGLEQTSEDMKLASRIAAGDMNAFSEFYSLYYRRIYALCFRMSRNRTEAEDLTHDVFVHVYRKINGYRGQSALMTWLHRVTINKVLMHFRRKEARPDEVSTEEETADRLAFSATSRSHVNTPARVELEKEIAALPPGYRMVLLLHDVEGYEHGEIATIAGISIGTSKSQLHKARRKLRKALVKPYC